VKNRVLLVGSNDQLQLALKFLFEMNGYLPETAQSHAEASRILDLGQADYVLLDLSVGQFEGEKILAHLESMPNPPPEVVVALTEHLGAEQLARIRALARKVIFRPFSFEQLLAAIQLHCQSV
jgi:DNA-binding response OmpR family regulator